MPSQSVSAAKPHALESSLSTQCGQPGCSAKDRELAPEVGAIGASYVVDGQCACFSTYQCSCECSPAVEIDSESIIVNHVAFKGDEMSAQGSCEGEVILEHDYSVVSCDSGLAHFDGRAYQREGSVCGDCGSGRINTRDYGQGY